MLSSNNADKPKIERLRVCSNEEYTPKKIFNPQTRNSLSRNSSKSPNPISKKSTLSQDPTNKSLNLSVDQDKVENSFTKVKIRTCVSSSKKIDKPQREQYNTLISNVYAVKKMNFLKISPLGKGNYLSGLKLI